MAQWYTDDGGNRHVRTAEENRETVSAVFFAWRDSEYKDQLSALTAHGLDIDLIEAMAEDAIVTARKHDAWALADQPRRDEIAALAESFIASARDVHARHGYDGPLHHDRIKIGVREAMKAAESVRPKRGEP